MTDALQAAGPETDKPKYTEEDIQNFNSLMQDLYEAAGNSGSAASNNKQVQIECLLEPTPSEWQTLSPQQQKYLRDQKCGTDTSATDLSYELNQLQKYQACITEYTLKSANLNPGDTTYPMYGGDPALHCGYLKPAF